MRHHNRGHGDDGCPVAAIVDTGVDIGAPTEVERRAACSASRAGRRYRTTPDTIDLQEMAAQAVGGLTGPTDPDADYEVFWGQRRDVRTGLELSMHEASSKTCR